MCCGAPPTAGHHPRLLRKGMRSTTPPGAALAMPQSLLGAAPHLVLGHDLPQAVRRGVHRDTLVHHVGGAAQQRAVGQVRVPCRSVMGCRVG